MTGIPDLGIRVDIMGRVLDPLLCVFLADIQSVGIGACMHVCVWYTELTCLSNGVSKTDIVVGKVQCVCVCVCVDSRDFPAFQNLGPGALDFGKNSAQI